MIINHLEKKIVFTSDNQDQLRMERVWEKAIKEKVTYKMKGGVIIINEIVFPLGVPEWVNNFMSKGV